MSDKKPKLHSFGLLGMEPVNFDEAWGQLESPLLSLLHNVGSGFPNDLWIGLVEKVYQICIGQGESSRLYCKLQEVLLEYNQCKLSELQEFQRTIGTDSLDFLSHYQNAFVNYDTDRPWITSNHCDTGRSQKEGVYFVHELALIIWKEFVFDALAPDLCFNILAVINDAREHNLMDLGDGGILQSVVDTYEILGFEKRDRSQLFQKHLEDYLIDDAADYFIRKGRQLIVSMPISQYMQESEKMLSEESVRNISFVGPYTAERMLLKAQEGLIFDHADRLVEEAAITMLVHHHEKRADLKRLYTLVTYVCYTDGDGCIFEGSVVSGETENQALNKLMQAVMNHIKNVGIEIVQNVEVQGGLLALQGSADDSRWQLAKRGVKKQGANSSDVVDMMINVYEHYSGLVKECLGDSPAFHSALDVACRIFVNALPRASEWLARYAHHLLDKDFKESRLSEDARNDALDHVGFLFGYITDKDVFHALYTNLLCKRIIQLTSQSDEAEERMLGNLRRGSSFEYTSKLQRMFVDKALSRELHTGYMRCQERLAMMKLRHDSPSPPQSLSGKMIPNGEEQKQSARTIMRTTPALQNRVFSFSSEDVHKDNRTGDGHVMVGNNGEGPVSPTMSPTYMSPTGLSPRMNILPSFAWGKTLFKHLRSGGSPSSKSSLHVSDSYLGEAVGGVGGGTGGDYYLSQSLNDYLNTVPAFEAFTFVLTAGCWSLQSVRSTFTPPKPIENYVKSFLQFYSESHSARKLEWLFHLGHGEMYARGFDKTYCIHSSTFQMGVLYQFRHAKRLTVQEIAKGVTIAEKELSRHLFPLIKVSCNDILPEHVVVVNEKFTSRHNRVKINIVDYSKQSAKEEHSVEEDVTTDRMRAVQASICRIMKSRKRMAHQPLCKEVQFQLKHLFVPNHTFIKRNVEELISKDYIERVKADEYIYCS